MDQSNHGVGAGQLSKPRKPINQLADAMTIDQVFVLGDKQQRTNRQGGQYLLLKLTDRTGTIVAMLWNADNETYDQLERGGYVQCAGRTQIHQGALQIILSSISAADPPTVNPADFDRFDANAADEAESTLTAILTGLSNPPLKQLASCYLQDESFMSRFRRATAAVSNHHAYPGGLLRHTVDLMELCQFIGPRYHRVNTDLLTFGAFLHDLGKIEEISCEGELTYTDRGQLVGHIVIGIQMLGEKIAEYETETGQDFPAELRMHLEHLVVSHHGQREYGSPCLPATMEAIALHHIDNLDAKVTSFDNLIESSMGNQDHWTPFLPSISRKLWKKPDVPNA